MDNHKNGENVSNDFSFTTFFTSSEDIQIIFLFLDMYLLLANKKKIEDIGNPSIKLNPPPLPAYKKKRKNASSMIFKVYILAYV